MEWSCNFLHGWSLLIYRNTSAFCMWSAKLLSVFVAGTSTFMVERLGDYIYMWNLAACAMVYFFLSYLEPFHFLFLSNCSGQRLSIVLNSGDENGHPCSVSDPSGQHFSPSTLITCLSVGFSSVPFIMLRKFLSIHVFLCFHHERVSDLLSAFSVFIEVINN